MMKWLTRKKPSNKERADVLQWIDYNNGVHGTEAQHKEYKKKYATVANKYDESEDPRYIDPKEVDAIKKSLPVSEMVKEEERFNDKILKRDKYEKPKKQIIKKTLIAKKPKTKPVPISPLPYDWRLAPWYDFPEDDDWLEGSEETYPWNDDVKTPAPVDIEKVLNIKKKEVAGLEAILNLHKKFVG